MATRYFRIAVVGLSLFSFAGCAQLPDWSHFGALPGVKPTVPDAHYSFDWRLSGDRRAGAIQVFDDGKSTWLQFSVNQPWPAIFASKPEGERVLIPRRYGEYAVVDGVWPVLILRAGALESRVERIQPDETNLSVSKTHELAAAQRDPVVDSPLEVLAFKSEDLSVAEFVEFANTSSSRAESIHQAESNVAQLSGVPSVAARESEDISFVPTLDSSAPAAGLVMSHSYDVSPQDGNLRLALVRWANVSGWTFEPEHWAVDVDIPIVGAATFEPEFSVAVQQLLASTELSERPLQPCFYANRVLRVVPYAQSCDRSMLRGRA